MRNEKQILAGLLKLETETSDLSEQDWHDAREALIEELNSLSKLKAILKDINKSEAIARRCTDEVKRDEFWSKASDSAIKAIALLGAGDGYDVEHADKARQAFSRCGLTTRNAYMLGNGDWS